MFVEFFAFWCSYCYYFRDSFNNIYDEFMDKYGPENVVIYKMEQSQSEDAHRKYGVPYYPYFVYFKPNSEGQITGKQRLKVQISTRATRGQRI